MARYDGGWGRPPGRPRYDDPFRTYGPPASGRPGGAGSAGLRSWGGPARPAYDANYGQGGYAQGGRGEPWGGGGGAGGTQEREEFWEPETIYGPARYGLGPYHERLRRQRRSDDELREEVEEALFYDTWVDADAITVEVRDGIVTLRGELPDYDEIRYATDDAWDVDGVRGVRSELAVRRGDRAPRSAGAQPQRGTQPGARSGASAGGGGGTGARATAASSSPGQAAAGTTGAGDGATATAKRTRKKSG